jgi:hypothetical protein
VPRSKSLPKTTMYMWPSCIGLLNNKIKFQLKISKYIFGFYIDIETKYDPYYNKYYYYLHQAPHYNQIYNFVLNHNKRNYSH